MPMIDWTTVSYEPDPDGRRVGGQLSVDVRGTSAAWADRFNSMADGQHRRGEVRGGRWGLVRYHEVEGLITVDDLYEGQEDAIRAHLENPAETARGVY